MEGEKIEKNSLSLPFLMLHLVQGFLSGNCAENKISSQKIIDARDFLNHALFHDKCLNQTQL